jgi:hypothetical protein
MNKIKRSKIKSKYYWNVLNDDDYVEYDCRVGDIKIKTYCDTYKGYDLYYIELYIGKSDYVVDFSLNKQVKIPHSIYDRTDRDLIIIKGIEQKIDKFIDKVLTLK